jgi:hypothetical protein
MRNATRELTGYVDVLTRRQLCATTRRRCKPVHFCVPFTVEEVRERGVGWAKETEGKKEEGSLSLSRRRRRRRFCASSARAIKVKSRHTTRSENSVALFQRHLLNNTTT